MASITQTIANYTSGISEQPDQYKNPGQVSEALNVVPDITTGLIKRPGSEFVKILSSSESKGSWFHYYRDQNEQYIGQISSRNEEDADALTYTPNVRLWSLKEVRDDSGTLLLEAGEEVSVTPNSAVDPYLRHNRPEDLQFLTISDYTYVVNRTKQVKMDAASKTDVRPDKNCAFVELKKTANARQYNLNIYDNNTATETIKTVTKLKVVKRTQYPNVTASHETYSKTHTFGVGGIPAIVTDGSGISKDLFSFPHHTSHPDTGSNDALDERPLIYDGVNIPGTSTDQTPNLAYEPTCPDIGTKVIGTDLDNELNVIKIWKVRDAAEDRSDFWDRMGMPLWNRNYGTETVTNYNGTGTTAYTGGWETAELGTTGRAQIFNRPKNLVFRFTVSGTSHIRGDITSAAGTAGSHYTCSYDYDIDLLNGGEGWEVGDVIEFWLPGRMNHNDKIVYQVEVETVSESKIRTTIDGIGEVGAIRPVPTAFDQETAVNGQTILGGLQEAVDRITNHTSGTPFTTKIIGSGLYITSADHDFNIESAEADLMNVITREVNDVSKLPTQCKHGYIVKVANSDSDEDDYYLKFKGDNDIDGPGSWIECANPDTPLTDTITDPDNNLGLEDAFDVSTMPIQLKRTQSSTGQVVFEVQPGEYPKRAVGDDVTNPKPSFVGDYIQNILVWRNRVIFLSSNNVIASQVGDENLVQPNFWVKTALTVSPEDVIDLATSSKYPAQLKDGLEVTSGLLLFSENQQFLMSIEAEVLTPETAQIAPLSTYNYNTKVSPFSLGTTVGFLDNAGAKSRFFEMFGVTRGREPDLVEQSVVVQDMMSRDINLVTNSRENNFAFFCVSGEKDVYGYRYWNSGEKRIQSSWFKWTLPEKITYQCAIDDTYYVVLDNKNLITFDLRTQTDTAQINEYLVHLDNYKELDPTEFTYDSDNNKTTFNLPGGFTADTDVAVIDTTPNDDNYKDFGRYDIATVVGSVATLNGDWATANHKLYIGYNFNMRIKLPTIYVTKSSDTASIADVNASLIIHRLKLALGKSGVYETTLERKGRDDYTELYESSMQDKYTSNTTPWVDEQIKTIPAYDRNTNLKVYLKSTHPSPATLRAMSWEGDYTTKFYQRA